MWECVDYRDLNRANLKDNFYLPYIDMLVDNIAWYSTFSFMDDFLGYNKIKMVEEDREKMAFPLVNTLLQSTGFWFEKCWGNISASNSYTFS